MPLLGAPGGEALRVTRTGYRMDGHGIDTGRGRPGPPHACLTRWGAGPAAPRHRSAFFGAAAIVVALDQFVKWYVVGNFGLYEILPVAPMLPEIERGQMRWLDIREPSISRTVVLCASRKLPPTTAVPAISTLAVDVVSRLCTSDAWPGATLP